MALRKFNGKKYWEEGICLPTAVRAVGFNLFFSLFGLCNARRVGIRIISCHGDARMAWRVFSSR